MTRISGYYINAAPCCDARYSSPRYSSMNFSAWEYWTDGYSDSSLMPGGHGLRKCKCGNFFLLAELKKTELVDETDVPYPDSVDPQELPQAIAQARTPFIELAARLDYWQHLNHPYRERYRAHRDAEEAATKAAWIAANPDRRTWWQRFRKVSPLQYVRPSDSPFTYPPYELSEAQRENLNAMLRLHESKAVQIDHQARAEMHRELGEFEQAAEALRNVEEKDRGVTSRLINKLAKDKETAPMRYRM